MKTYQLTARCSQELKQIPNEVKQWDSAHTLVIIFSPQNHSELKSIIDETTKLFSHSIVTGCSTSGGIIGDKVHDNSFCISISHFEYSKLKYFADQITSPEDSFRAGNQIATQLNQKNLKGVLVFSDGLITNGSALVSGFNSVLDSKQVSVSGGLAGDDDRFKSTWVLHQGQTLTGVAVGVGFYGGDELVISTASRAGWDIFGPERSITKSKDNILYEIDGKPALDLYKLYLGEYSASLPASALLFPLQIRKDTNADTRLVRTILGVDEKTKSLIFAGDMPEGWRAQLMKSNIDKLVDRAMLAAEQLSEKMVHSGFNFNEDFSGSHMTIAISCVGRRLVLADRVEEEIEALKNTYTKSSSIVGFYSYGELAPSAEGKPCELHNQSMTLMNIIEHKKSA